MSNSAHLVEYKPARLGGSQELYDILLIWFDNGDNQAVITKDTWERLLEIKPELKEEYPNETKEITQDIEENGDQVTYEFF